MTGYAKVRVRGRYHDWWGDQDAAIWFYWHCPGCGEDSGTDRTIRLLTAYENRHRELLPIAKAAKREIKARRLFDSVGTATAFEYLGRERETLEALVDTWTEPE